MAWAVEAPVVEKSAPAAILGLVWWFLGLGDFVIELKFNWTLILILDRNSYSSQFCYMYGGLTQDQVGTRNRADGGEGE